MCYNIQEFHLQETKFEKINMHLSWTYWENYLEQHVEKMSMGCSNTQQNYVQDNYFYLDNEDSSKPIYN